MTLYDKYFDCIDEMLEYSYSIEEIIDNICLLENLDKEQLVKHSDSIQSLYQYLDTIVV